MFFLRANRAHPEFRVGMRDMLAIAPGTAAWGLMTGVAMVKSGLSTVESLLMATLVFAGSAQLAAIPLIAASAPIWVILATALCVNLRFVVFSAHLRPYMMHLPLAKRLASGYFTADLSYVLFTRRFVQPATDAAGRKAQEAYLAYRHTLDFGKISGKDLKWGVVRGWGLTEMNDPRLNRLDHGHARLMPCPVGKILEPGQRPVDARRTNLKPVRRLDRIAPLSLQLVQNIGQAAGDTRAIVNIKLACIGAFSHDLQCLIIPAEQLYAHEIETQGFHLRLNQLRQGGHIDQFAYLSERSRHHGNPHFEHQHRQRFDGARGLERGAWRHGGPHRQLDRVARQPDDERRQQRHHGGVGL